MDTITHIAVGGIVGDVMVGRLIGKRAMILGAAFQSLPDIDFIASFFLDPVSDLIAHRGITHSILFSILVTPPLAYIARHIYRKYNVPLKTWILFIGTEIIIHLFLDAFNAYGTGWFEPFSNARVSFNSIFVADPLFSILPVIAFVVMLFTRREYRWRKWWANLSLGMICLYLSVSVISKLIVFNEVEKIAEKKGISYKRYFTTPTPLNTILWFVVLENDSGYNVGYRSVFDRKPDMDFYYFPQNKHLLDSIEDYKPVQQLQEFSQGYYTVQKWGDTLVFNDLRFGQMIGWKDLSARFAFYYYLQHPDDNLLVIQRGRFQGWDGEALRKMWKRMKGD